MEAPANSAKIAFENQEKSSEGADTAAADATKKVGEAEKALKAGEKNAADKAEASKAADIRHGELDTAMTDADATLTDAKKELSTAQAAVTEASNKAELAKNTRDDAQADYTANKQASDEAAEKLKKAAQEAKELKTVTIPEAENTVKQAQAKAATSQEAAKVDRAQMEAREERAKEKHARLEINEAAEFKVYTKEHKSLKDLDRAHSNSELNDKLAENEKEFYADTADHQATRMDSAKEVLDQKKQVYEHYNEELQKANAGGVVELSY